MRIGSKSVSSSAYLFVLNQAVSSFFKGAFWVLEPDDGKSSSPVLTGLGASNGTRPLDNYSEMSVDCLTPVEGQVVIQRICVGVPSVPLRIAYRPTHSRPYCCLLLPRGFRKSCRVKEKTGRGGGDRTQPPKGFND